MTRKEKMELLLSKVAQEQKAAFVAELREAQTKESRQALFEKYNIRFSEEEMEGIKTVSSDLSDSELDVAAGGCCSSSNPCTSCFHPSA